MTDTWTDEFEESYDESFDDSFDDSYDDSFDDSFDEWGGDEESSFDDDSFDEASTAARRRRARSQAERARRRRLARARAARRRSPRARRSGSTARQSPSAAIRSLDLDNRVQNDAIQQAFARRDARARRAEFATVAGVATGLVAQTFKDEGFLKHAYGRAALAASPLLLLDPPKQGTGAGSLLRDPRVVGAGIIAGLAIFGDRRGQAGKVAKIEPLVPNTITEGQSFTLNAKLLDARGNSVSEKTVTWTVSGDNASIVGDVLTAKTAPGATVVAKVAGEAEHTFFLTITPAAVAPPPGGGGTAAGGGGGGGGGGGAPPAKVGAPAAKAGAPAAGGPGDGG